MNIHQEFKKNRSSYKLVELMNYCDKSLLMELDNNKSLFQTAVENNPSSYVLETLINLLGNDIFNCGENPLMIAEKMRLSSYIKAVLIHKAKKTDLKKPDKKGETILDKYIKNGDSYLSGLVIDSLKEDLYNNGMTNNPLVLAINNNSSYISSLIISRCNKDHCIYNDFKGKSILEYASDNQYISGLLLPKVKHLLVAKANKYNDKEIELLINDEDILDKIKKNIKVFIDLVKRKFFKQIENKKEISKEKNEYPKIIIELKLEKFYDLKKNIKLLENEELTLSYNNLLNYVLKNKKQNNVGELLILSEQGNKLIDIKEKLNKVDIKDQLYIDNEKMLTEIVNEYILEINNKYSEFNKLLNENIYKDLKIEKKLKVKI